MCDTFLRPLVAHTPNKNDTWHALQSHLECVADQAEVFAGKFNAGTFARSAGLWHDAGKSFDGFQEYLRLCAFAATNNTKPPARGPDHKTAGSVLAFQEKLLPVAFAIQGHHGGLPNMTDLRVTLKERSAENYIQQAIQKTSGLFEQFRPADFKELEKHPAVQSPLEAELFTRMLYSCLVDADFLDTEQHFDESKTNMRAQYASLNELWERFHTDQEHLQTVSTGGINQLRREIYQTCLESANQKQGIYRLTVPTGGGKTRASLGFALQHALKHQLNRVIVVIPYTSIIEQTADVYRSILGDDTVIEHHSGVQFAEDPDNPSQGEIKARLATENWDAPLVVTTSVQFFDSLFSSKPSKCRKLHNISRSVIILDEVQTLPAKLLGPICDVLQQLVKHYSSTVVLCTATQPAWEHSPWLQTQTPIAELVPEASRYFEALQRVNYEMVMNETWTWEQVRDRLMDFDQVLCVVNTKTDAMELLDLMPVEGTYHLSTLLCGANRRDVLAEVREKLKLGEPCRLISTQVVEAGVDIDFPAVFRALGPLDRIVQAAGRCNREGKMVEKGHVIVFKPAEPRLPPGEYKLATETALTILAQQQWDLNAPDVFSTYFRDLYQLAQDAKGKEIQQLRQQMQFAEVSQKFNLIDDDTVSVVVRYESKAAEPHHVEDLLTRLNQPWHSTRATMRLLQPYTVSVRRFTFSKYQQEGLVREIMPGFYEWLGQYDSHRGLICKTIAPEDLVL